jgi:hypothetical protein
MRDIKRLTDTQVRHAIETGEFDTEVIHSCERVAVVMTQDWCPQWVRMRTWLESIEETFDVDVYEVIYNTAPYYSEFLDLKEQKWGNDAIPYVRYYVGGKLTRESNYVTKETFFSHFGL